MEERIIKIPAEEIEKVLAEGKRIYLAGDLKKPEKVQHIANKFAEVGISSYKGDEGEDPHFHTKVFDFWYILEGEIALRDNKTGEVHEFKKGDFFQTKQNVCFSTLVRGPCRVIFVKAPSLNDKTSCDKCGKKECKYRRK